MKKNIPFLFLFIISMLLVSSCGKDDDSGNGGNGGGTSITKITISPVSKFEGDINYVIATKVPKTTFGATATNTLNGLLGQVKSKTGVDLSTSDNIDLELVVGGTVTEPAVKPRISGIMGDEGAKGKIDEVKTQVKEKVKEKVEETKEDVNKKIAEERHRYMEGFLKQFYAEWQGEK